MGYSKGDDLISRIERNLFELTRVRLAAELYLPIERFWFDT